MLHKFPGRRTVIPLLWNGGVRQVFIDVDRGIRLGIHPSPMRTVVEVLIFNGITHVLFLFLYALERMLLTLRKQYR